MKNESTKIVSIDGFGPDNARRISAAIWGSAKQVRCVALGAGLDADERYEDVACSCDVAIMYGDDRIEGYVVK